MKKIAFFLFILAIAAGCAKESSEPQKPIQEKTLEERVFDYAKALNFQGYNWPEKYSVPSREGNAIPERVVKELEATSASRFQLQKFPSGNTLSAIISTTGWRFIAKEASASVEVQMTEGQTKYTFK